MSVRHVLDRFTMAQTKPMILLSFLIETIIDHCPDGDYIVNVLNSYLHGSAFI